MTADIPVGQTPKGNAFIYQCDGLSSQNFCPLPLTLTRQLSQINTGKHTKPLLDSLKTDTIAHDYFHKICMHHLDCIYRSKYGCLLQPFQPHLGYNRLNGEPTVENHIQTYCIFRVMMYESLCIHSFNFFSEASLLKYKIRQVIY